MYSLPCPDCQKPIAVSASKAGQRVPCPHCQGVVDVPKLGELRGLELVDGAQPESSGRAAATEGVSAGRSFAFGALGLIATASLLVAGYCGIRWYLIDVPTTSDTHVAEVKKAFEDASAATMILEYESMEEYGIDVTMPYPYKKIANTKAEWGFNAAVAAAVGAASIASACVVGSRG